MATIQSRYTMTLPNNTLREIFVDDYNELNHFDIKTCLIYIAGNKRFRFFSLEDGGPIVMG